MSTHLRALWLAWGAVVALLAYPSHARILGQQTGIMGSEDGIWRPATTGASVTIDAMPYTRTVTCDTYTLTGTFTGSTPTWSASPSGESGSCSDTGGGTFSCVVDVDPDATGEGVETITVTNGASDTETIGFYVAGSHSCFISQSVDGSYNSTLADNDPVATWENLGSSALDVTQGTGTAQPTFKTAIVGGNPIVRCDGGDFAQAATASDWTFLHNGSGATVGVVGLSTLSGGSVYTLAGSAPLASASIGAAVAINDSSVSDGARGYLFRGSAPLAIASSAANTFPLSEFSLAVVTTENLVGDDIFLYVNGVADGSAAATSFSASSPTHPFTLCAAGTTGTNGFPLTGDLFRVIIYSSALTSTQRGINQAVDEWALGGTLPVTP